MTDTPKPPDEGQQYVFRPFITLPNGTVIWARNYGKKAFRIPVGPVSDRKPELRNRSVQARPFLPSHHRPPTAA